MTLDPDPNEAIDLELWARVTAATTAYGSGMLKAVLKDRQPLWPEADAHWRARLDDPEVFEAARRAFDALGRAAVDKERHRMSGHVALLDPEGRIVDLPERMAALLGSTREALIGTLASALISPLHQTTEPSAVVEVLRAKGQWTPSDGGFPLQDRFGVRRYGLTVNRLAGTAGRWFLSPLTVKLSASEKQPKLRTKKDLKMRKGDPQIQARALGLAIDPLLTAPSQSAWNDLITALADRTVAEEAIRSVLPAVEHALAAWPDTIVRQVPESLLVAVEERIGRVDLYRLTWPLDLSLAPVDGAAYLRAMERIWPSDDHGFTADSFTSMAKVLDHLEIGDADPVRRPFLAVLHDYLTAECDLAPRTLTVRGDQVPTLWPENRQMHVHHGDLHVTGDLSLPRDRTLIVTGSLRVEGTAELRDAMALGVGRDLTATVVRANVHCTIGGTLAARYIHIADRGFEADIASLQAEVAIVHSARILDASAVAILLNMGVGPMSRRLQDEHSAALARLHPSLRPSAGMDAGQAYTHLCETLPDAASRATLLV